MYKCISVGICVCTKIYHPPIQGPCMSTTRLFWNKTRCCPKCGFLWEARGKTVDAIQCPDCKVRLSRIRELPNGEYENIGVLDLETISREWHREQNALDQKQRELEYADKKRRKARFQHTVDMWQIESDCNTDPTFAPRLAKRLNLSITDLQKLLTKKGLTIRIPEQPVLTAENGEAPTTSPAQKT